MQGRRQRQCPGVGGSPAALRFLQAAGEGSARGSTPLEPAGPHSPLTSRQVLTWVVSP